MDRAMQEQDSKATSAPCRDLKGRPLLVEAIGITKTFGGFTALDDINLMFKGGEIHCLAGENGSGKSTLVKIISGAYTPDKGSIVINGKSYSALNPAQSMAEGIQVIYQDLALFEHMSVAENIALGRLRENDQRLINWKKVDAIAQAQLERIGVQLDLRQELREASISTKQLVAICRALAMDAKVLFMDEPTTALSGREVDRLLEVMADLKKSGLAVIFISHKLDEVFRIANVVTVFRDGRKIGDFPSGDLNARRLSYYMTGKEISYPKYQRVSTKQESFVEIHGLCKKNMYQDINLSVRPGDIMGCIGLLGSGRTELALSLFGLNPPDGGDIIINGHKTSINSPSAAMEAGIALLPEDRSTEGLFLERSVAVNATAAIIDKLCHGWFKCFDFRRERECARQDICDINIKTKKKQKLAGELSGGNQQKVVLAKWLATKPRLFIMDNPTVGIDIGSKAEIYETAQSLARRDMAVLLLSDEVEELTANCNRIAIFARGRIIEILDEKRLADPHIGSYITKVVAAGRRLDDVVSASADANMQQIATVVTVDAPLRDTKESGVCK